MKIRSAIALILTAALAVSGCQYWFPISYDDGCERFVIKWQDIPADKRTPDGPTREPAEVGPEYKTCEAERFIFWAVLGAVAGAVFLGALFGNGGGAGGAAAGTAPHADAAIVLFPS